VAAVAVAVWASERARVALSTGATRTLVRGA